MWLGGATAAPPETWRKQRHRGGGWCRRSLATPGPREEEKAPWCLVSGHLGRGVKGGDIGEESDAAAKNRPPGRRMGGLNPISPGWIRRTSLRSCPPVTFDQAWRRPVSALFFPVCSA